MNFTILSYDENLGTILIWHGRVRAGTSERLKFMRGWHFFQVRKYCHHRGWVMHQLPPPDADAIVPMLDHATMGVDHAVQN